MRKPLPTILALATSLLAAAHAPSALGQGEAGWITHADAGARTPIVLQFRRELTLDRVPAKLPVSVTADNRFILYVNGQRVASGPSTGTVKSWRQRSLDLAPHLKRGKNVIAAVVWNFGDVAPASQQIVATGFRLIGEPISTSAAGWRVRIDDSRTAVNAKEQISWQYYVASAPEVIDARKINDEHWQDAVPAPAAAARTLIADPFPPQLFVAAAPGKVVRSSLEGGDQFPARPVVIPPNTTAKLLIQRDAMISAYPALEVQGGAGCDDQSPVRRGAVRQGWKERRSQSHRRSPVARFP